MEFSWGMGPPSTYGGGWWRMFPRTPDALKVRCRIADAAAAASGHHPRMDIILNGPYLPLPDQTTLAALLEPQHLRSADHPSELKSQTHTSSAVFSLKKHRITHN